jgi:hypothetical protein
MAVAQIEGIALDRSHRQGQEPVKKGPHGAISRRKFQFIAARYNSLSNTVLLFDAYQYTITGLWQNVSKFLRGETYERN